MRSGQQVHLVVQLNPRRVATCLLRFAVPATVSCMLRGAADDTVHRKTRCVPAVTDGC